MRRLFALVAAVILVDTMFLAAIVPLLPSYVEELGLSKSAAGILSASYAAGTLLGALPAGWLAARIGVRPALLLGLGLIAASSFAFAFAAEILLLDLARFAQGVGGAFAWSGGLAWLLGAGPREHRGELVGSVMAFAIAGFLLGPLIGGLATVTGEEVVFSAVGVIALALAAWALATPGVAPTPVAPLGRIARAMSVPAVLTAAWLVLLPSMVAGLVDVLGPLRLDELGASGIAVGAVFLIAAALEAIASPFIGRLSDRRGRWWPIRAGLLLTPVVAICAPLPATIAGTAVIVTVIFLAMSLLWTPAMTLLSEEAERAGLDLAFGTALVSLAYAGGSVLGGSALVALADASSDAVAYFVCAGLFVLTLAWVSASARERRGEVPASG